MTVRGIDVASYQPPTPAVAGNSFVWVKATEGLTYVNPHMASQAAAARKAGAVVGFYHFLHPGGIAAQVAHFLKTAPEQAGDMFGCDWETPQPPDKAASSEEKDQFLRVLKGATKVPHRVVLYCNLDFWLHRDKTSQCGDGLWIADPNSPAGHPKVQHAWTFHQYGITAGTDQNVGQFADINSLRAWAGVTLPKPPAGAPAAPTLASLDKRLTSVETRVTALEKK
ncbi:Lyzozyme M1 (1,4-beta-N-acetylmuramidase), GH25 family [Streptomyces sp. DvalAA-14]|uniref:glycoside hydrolase family 25 protein n=1 Tax=unclassified Streptomyces TaxID=2593676 RepID=UPI00081B60CF|nr:MULTISPECIES: GH25 family lysozyme [unclassified Streptomyces]MYS19173.1 muramidase [Streptomyces sp. SID4948]SCD38315.1 Lyzozyme M1 (1,4-beta-N-acetylmuramidase), GH25 family [Streptomyces sp. DvalAA-14]